MNPDTLWYTRCPGINASSIAISQGWLEREFARDGIEVLSLLQDSARGGRESHFAHDRQNSFRHGGNIPPIWARANGAEIRVIGLTWSETPYFVIALPESGIRTAADLKGRRLALPRRVNDSVDFARAMYLRVYEQALKSGGVDRSDVELVDLAITSRYLDDSSPPSRTGALWNASQLRGFQRHEVLALLRGEVDAIPSSGFWAAEHSAALGTQTVYDSRSARARGDRVNSGNPSVLSVSARLVDERPDLVARWIVSLLQAAEWGRGNPLSVRRIAGLENGVAEAFVDITEPGGLNDHLGVSLSDSIIGALAAQKDWLLAEGLLSGDIDVDKWVAREPLEQARQHLGLP